MDNKKQRPPKSRHNVYLSDQIWTEARTRALLETYWDSQKGRLVSYGDPSGLIEYLLQEYLKAPTRIPADRYRKRVDPEIQADDPVRARTIRISSELATQVNELIAGKTSFSHLVDYLLRSYLVNAVGEENVPPAVQIDTEKEGETAKKKGNLVNMGGVMVDLGSDPFKIDLTKPGK